MTADWRLRAACRGGDPDAPFAGDGTTQQQAFIDRVCGSCPVLLECLDDGTRRDQPGVYGGMSQRQRSFRRHRLAAGLVAHGTRAGYRRHVKFKDPLCVPCKAAVLLPARAAVA